MHLPTITFIAVGEEGLRHFYIHRGGLDCTSGWWVGVVHRAGEVHPGGRGETPFRPSTFAQVCIKVRSASTIHRNALQNLLKSSQASNCNRPHLCGKENNMYDWSCKSKWTEAAAKLYSRKTMRTRGPTVVRHLIHSLSITFEAYTAVQQIVHVKGHGKAKLHFSSIPRMTKKTRRERYAVPCKF
jgi:hypothetical protein